MIYKIDGNKIIVFDKSQFNPKHILECGQVFRFGKDENENYFVISKNMRAKITEIDDHFEILSENPKYFVHYFDLDTDYNAIKNDLKKFKVLEPMLEFGYGIRILNADPEEMIFEFLISQNNNIKRIQKIIEKLCIVGEDSTENGIDFKSFPTSKTLASLPLEFYQSLGAGYRDKFLFETAKTISETNIDEIKKLDTNSLYNFLISLKGVGPKVASCILLFGFGRKDKFPVDTWCEQIYYNHFEKTKRTRKEIQKYFEDMFGKNSGLAQQYLFYFERSKSEKI